MFEKLKPHEIFWTNKVGKEFVVLTVNSSLAVVNSGCDGAVKNWHLHDIDDRSILSHLETVHGILGSFLF